MFYFVHKQKMIGIGCVLLGLGMLLYCGVLHQRQMDMAVSAVSVTDKVIVVDPGHGGFDAGASGNNVQEKTVNLAVALYLKEYIEQGGNRAILTREEDVSTAPENREGKSAKRADLEARKHLPVEAGADVFVSIHMNQFPQSRYKGAQVFYANQPEGSKRLGEEIQASLKEILADGNTRQAKKIDGNIFILQDATVPSVIVECGFLSNPQEALLLTQEEYQRKLAQAIYTGLIRFFNS